MNRMKFLIAAFAIGMIASVGQTVNANPPTAIDCSTVTGGAIHDQLAALCDATQATRFTKPQDQDALEAKILGAGTKVDQYKLSDAEKKLRDYETNLMSMMSTCPVVSKKINCTDAAAKIQPALGAAYLALDQLQ